MNHYITQNWEVIVATALAYDFKGDPMNWIVDRKERTCVDEFTMVIYKIPNYMDLT